MTIKEYLNQVFAHTEKTADTEALRQELLIEMKTQEETYILEDDMTPDEAEEEVLLKSPTPDEFREELGIKPNVLSETDRFFSFFRWFAKGLITLLALYYLLEYSNIHFYFLESNSRSGILQSSIIFYYISFSLFINLFAVWFIMNKPDSSNEGKIRKNILIGIGLISHPIGLPTLLIGLLYDFTRMQKNHWFKQHLASTFKSKKKPIVVYSLTLMMFVGIGLSGASLASGLFNEPTEDSTVTVIKVEKTEGDRVYQSGSVALVPVENDAFRVEIRLVQYQFNTVPINALENVDLVYNINGIEIEGTLEKNDQSLNIEDSVITRQDRNSFVENFSMHVQLNYDYGEGEAGEYEYYIGISDIIGVSESSIEDSDWIWN